MGRPNAGGGRHNQPSNAVPTRAMFSSFASGKQGGKGGKGDKGEKGSKARRPVFESQKEMDKWKAAQKGGQQRADPAPAPSHSASTESASIWRTSKAPSYLHGVFCLTKDDHMALEPLLNPSFAATGVTPVKPGLQGEDTLPFDLEEEATEHLRALGFLQSRIRPALQTVGPALVQECEEKEMLMTVQLVAERALEYLCSVSAEKDLPSKLREPLEVASARKRQEARNTAFQARTLCLDGEIDGLHISRLEKLGFSRAKALEALSKSPGHEVLPAAKALLAGYLPLELEAGAAGGERATAEDLDGEAEALKGAYGDELVEAFENFGNFELSVQLPETEWRLAVLLPEDLPYPHVSPLLCPMHPRLREAGRPRLLGALGDVCRDNLGGPMLFTLCEWLRDEGELYLVRPDAGDGGERGQALERQPSTAVQRSLEASEEQRRKEESDAAEKSRRCEYLKALQEEEEAGKIKDKLALEIRTAPNASKQHDLAGYEDSRARELVKEAFAQPLRVDKMVRITFIIGGGKSVRQKYNDSLGKAVGNALLELGFQLDAHASLTPESAGTFKAQHDTERNLKLVHVFPRIEPPSGADAAGAENESADAATRRVACLAWAEFVEEASLWVRSREQRPKAEALLHFLDDASSDLEGVEALIISGKTVDEAKRRLYNELGSAEDAAEKSRWLEAALSAKARPGAAAKAAADGSTLSIDAPSRLAEAASLAGVAGQASAADHAESDHAWLQRRVQQARAESERMRKDFARSKPLDSVRQSLPSAALRERIQGAVRSGQVIVIEGDTGCGKSTQVPQFILEDWVARGEGAAANIIMTQPRRISAIGVAERISAEVDGRCGDLVGYSIRLESKKSARTKILVCTTGVVLRRLEADRSLHGVTHIVVDECHERDLDTDFLLIVLRDLLPKRPGLKVILMSATINAEIFREYFGNCESIHIPGRTFPVTAYFLENALDQTGFVVEPDSQYSRRDAEELTHHEAEELEQLYQQDKYRELVGGDVSYRVCQMMHRMDPERINFDLVAAVVRYIHTNVDPPTGSKSPGAILVFVPGLGEIKRCIRALTDEDPFSKDRQAYGSEKGSSKGGNGKGGKGSRSAATAHPQGGDGWNGSGWTADGWSGGGWKGDGWTGDGWSSGGWKGDGWSGDGGAGAGWNGEGANGDGRRGRWRRDTAPGSETSWDSSSQYSATGASVPTSNVAAVSSSKGLWVLPLHSMISVAEQRLVFQRPQDGRRKVVVTTNIAETSITIDDVEYVVDCGRHKQTKYDPQNRVSMLVDCMETKANAKQRRGRAGRVKAGVCYHLVNARKWRRMDDFERPEMLRVPLDSLCLRIALLGLGNPAKFLNKALTPPSEAAVKSSLQQLVELDAVELPQRQQPAEDGPDAGEAAAGRLDKEDQARLLRAKLRLTPLGAHLAQLPVDAGVGKLLVLGCLFGIPHDACVLAAALSTKSPFQASIAEKDSSKRRLELAGDLESDQLLLLSLFEKWEQLGKRTQAARTWCRTNGLDAQTFETVSEMRAHLLQVLVEQGFADPSPEHARRGKGGASAATHGEGGDRNWMPPCLTSVATAAKEEFTRRKRQLLRSLLCAALWPDVVLRKEPSGQLVARNAHSLTFHPSSILSLQEERNQEAQSGDWNCPSCTFFNFGSREFCKVCETEKPGPGGQAKARAFRHHAFMFSEKTKTLASGSQQAGRKPQTHVRDCCGVSLKAMLMLGHHIAPDYLTGRVAVDGWVHCQAAPRDAAMLLGLRRLLQEVLSRRLSRASATSPAAGNDAEVIDAVTALLVMDAY